MRDLPPHVSHSQLSSWTGMCQKMFQLERLQGAPVTPAWYLVGGGVVHTVTEELDRHALEFGFTSAEQLVTMEIGSMTEDHLTRAILREEEKSGVKSDDWIAAGVKPRQDGNWWREKAPEMVSNWLTWRMNTGWEIAEFPADPYETDPEEQHTIPGIELDFNVTMGIHGKEREVVGAPDRIFRLPNGELVVADLKTGSSTPKTVLQQGLYATLTERDFGVRPKYGTFVKVGPRYGGQHTTLAPLAKYDERYFQNLFTAFRAQVETGTFLPNVSDMCDRCGVAGACYAAGGAESAKYDPLDPNYNPKGSK